MLYGVFSDVHSNLEALKAILNFFQKTKIDNLVCCGDLVGYGPQPNECVETVSNLKNLKIVIGNHDAAVAKKMDLKWFNKEAIFAIEYTSKTLDGKFLNFLAGLPEIIQTENFSMVHGSPRNHLKEYMLSEEQFIENFDYWISSPCFIGHSHIPMYFSRNNNATPEMNILRSPNNKISIGDETIAMFNPGGVGQPRDGNPFASCGLYNSDTKTFEIFRFQYDVSKTQTLMKEKKFPQPLIDRLTFGL